MHTYDFEFLQFIWFFFSFSGKMLLKDYESGNKAGSECTRVYTGSGSRTPSWEWLGSELGSVCARVHIPDKLVGSFALE